MADERDPLAAFDSGGIEAVARDRGLAPEAVRDLIRDHQLAVRRLPGVDDLVYEWRRTFPQDPLVDRRADAYYLALPRHVWPEFGTGLSDGELRALRAAHERQFGTEFGVDELAARDPMVLTRP
jgi:hypothetical protein